MKSRNYGQVSWSGFLQTRPCRVKRPRSEYALPATQINHKLWYFQRVLQAEIPWEFITKLLTFIVPLKSKRVATSWPHVCRLFKRAIASACAQTSAKFRVIAVCNEIPDGDWKDPRLEFISIDSEVPANAGARQRRDDVSRKRLIGLNRAVELSCSHVMFLDSDDCVSNKLAEHVAKNPLSNGWYLRSGYFYSEKQKRLHLERWRFSKWCGSSYIVRPEHLDYVERRNDGIHMCHTRMTNEFKSRGHPLQALPFHGGIYCVSHGENFHDYEPILWPKNPLLSGLRRLLFHRALTDSISEEFGLYPVSGKDQNR